MTRKLPELTDMLQDLIGTPSVSCVDSPLDMSNRPVAEIAAGWLENIGFTVEIADIAGFPGKVNLLATLGRGNGGLVLAGHLDTVPATESGWRGDPFRLRRDGDDVVGLGTADMKSFLAIAIAAAARFRGSDLREPVIILGTADEESSMCGGKALVHAGQPRARHAVIGEPTGLRPVRAHKGILFEAIRVHGAAGHSSNPALGHNALEGMHKVMQALMDFRGELMRDWHNPIFDVPQPTLNFGHLHGGDTPNRICAEAELHIDLRTLPGMALPDFRRKLHQRVTDALEKTPFSVSFTPLFDGVDALETAAEAPLVRALEAMTGHPAGAVAFSTEGPYLRELDMDVVVYGPGDIDQAHQPEERVSVQALLHCERHLVQLIEKFCLQSGN
ncbi:MAG TPA: acetylornithine deacetylase, partial [Gammaproteobacteria bacterium]